MRLYKFDARAAWVRLSILLLAACAAPSCPAFADPLVTHQPALSFEVVTSPQEQFWVNSIIIEGTRER
jgi:hypothetical protein